MTDQPTTHVSEEESRAVAEASRQTEWTSPSFMKELFLGNFRLDLVHPYPAEPPERAEFKEYYRKLERFLTEEVDSTAIDATGEYPQHVLDELRELGAFGMKIPKEYGGLGFSQIEYQKVMELLGSTDGNLTALLSAHQSIGVPQPLKLFGSPEQKKKFLPRCAAGEISAFALTEPGVGSDPARMSTTAELSADGSYYLVNGTKLWCTNGTLAKLLVVMAVHPGTKKISAFVVEADSPGVKVEHRCHFMGLKALANAVISFHDVKVPAENLIGKEGRGLKIALTTLNDGRLSIPNSAIGAAKVGLKICREWSNERVQWGRPVGKHEAISHKLADMAATTFAMESIARLATHMADSGTHDIRLEAAACKLWNTTRGWEIVDDTMQIRGGRGYETEISLRDRGEVPIPVERMMRDYRINRIFEGSDEIMRLFMAREAVDKHLAVAGALVEGKGGMGEKLKALPGIAAFYAWWYPSRWLGWGRFPRFSGFGANAGHLRFVERSCRKLSREIFHGMMIHQAKLAYKQGFLFRVVDIADELFAMTASVSRVQAMFDAGDAEAKAAQKLVHLFCSNSRRKVKRLFQELWSNDDTLKYKTALGVLKGDQLWMESLLEGHGRVAKSERGRPQAVDAAAAREAAPVAAG
ncbi:MAG: acyl-CoA dehydrogenase family protein [Acidimicrobiales bacterium]|nr:acyl-CoA dehydrogenase family protein [Acidimicrobiales bacterium]MCB1057323.1 acyl-CoA dehydrogenase family protein [Acidobacteriota bacterium]